MMIILPNLQDKASCKYKVPRVHTEMAMYLKYRRRESGIETYKIKYEVEGNYEGLVKVTRCWKILTQKKVSAHHHPLSLSIAQQQCLQANSKKLDSNIPPAV